MCSASSEPPATPPPSDGAVVLGGELIPGFLEQLPSGLAYCRVLYTDGRATDLLYLYTNPSFRRLVPLDNVVGRRLTELIPLVNQTDPLILETCARIAAHGEPETFELRVEALDMWFAVQVFCPKPDHLIATFTDVTARRHTEQALRESESRLRIMADHAPVLIWMSGAHGEGIWFNKVWLTFTGRSVAQEVGEGWTASVHPEDLRRYRQSYAAAMRDRHDFGIEFRLRRADGEYRWLAAHGVTRRDDEGRFLGFIGSCIDITQRHMDEEQIAQLAFYDPLTRLPTRRLLQDRLEHALAHSRRTGRFGALMMLDLDHFKPLNDQHGHRTGDALLVEVGNRLRGSIRQVDTAARYGGDEFVVILGNLGLDAEESMVQAAGVAEKIRAALAAPYVLSHCDAAGAPDTVEHVCSASIGVALFSAATLCADTLFSEADAAMYLAKHSGRNAVFFHQERGAPCPVVGRPLASAAPGPGCS